jgi:hypothetical protein
LSVGNLKPGKLKSHCLQEMHIKIHLKIRNENRKRRARNKLERIEIF